MTRPTYGSLFSGVGGMDMGFDTHMDCVFQVEWDKNCQSILNRHWPDVPKWHDVQDVNGAELPPCDVLTFGSPCQDLSVAGKRAGLKGDKSSMFFEATRIIKEMRNATASRPTGPVPRVVVWENVPGALTSNNGEDFQVVLNTMENLGAVEQEWCVLDAQYFGVPQRRRRIFLVVIFDIDAAARCPETILPVKTGSRRRDTQSRKEKQNNAGTLETSSPEDRRSIAFSHTQGLDLQPSYDAFPTLRREGAGHAVAVAYDEYNDSINDTHHTMRAGTKQSTGVIQDMIVRRLTPVECERLMGWPDDHTRYTDTGKEQADTHRYKQCGNGVATPVAGWIAKQITQLLKGNDNDI